MRVVSLVEEITGLKSRWNGGIRIVGPEVQMLSRRLFQARMDCAGGFTVDAELPDDELGCRTLIDVQTVLATRADWLVEYPKDYAIWDAGEPLAMLEEAMLRTQSASSVVAAK